MNDVVVQALSLWGLPSAEYQLVAARENAVYKVTTSTGVVALRLHRQGYRNDQELWSELQWMAAIAAGRITVPEPLPSVSGDLLHLVDDVQVDVLTWLSGVPVSTVFETLNTHERSKLFLNIGQTMATMHEISDAWEQPAGFTRCSWNRDGLLGNAPLWNRFWDNPELSPADRELFLNLRDKARMQLKCLESSLDYGLIHADMVPDNVMVDNDNIHLIDFDDGGFGFRIFDIATALLKHTHSTDYDVLKTSLIDGYHSVRNIDLTALDLFMILRSASYVGWNMTRLNEQEGKARNERFISTTRSLAIGYSAA